MMSREKLPMPSSADSSLNKPGLLNKFRDSIKALILCGALIVSGCATASKVQINSLPTKPPASQDNKVSKPGSEDAHPRHNKDKKVKPGNEVKDDEDKSGSRGYREREDIPCDELDFSEPGACVQV